MEKGYTPDEVRLDLGDDDCPDEPNEQPTIHVDENEGVLLYDHKGNEMLLRRRIGFV